jgi:FixJ family two-component response regulator
VFVVDDDVSVRESLELLILSAGWHPETFASAEDFLVRSRIDGPSCLVLDVTLPDLNGLDLQKRIVDRSDMPIIFITGYGDVPTTVRAMKAGAAEFLTKPFADEVLRQAITQAIERSHAELAQEAELREIRNCHASLTPRDQHRLLVVDLVEGQVLAAPGPRSLNRLDTHERHRPVRGRLTQHPPPVTSRLARHRPARPRADRRRYVACTWRSPRRCPSGSTPPRT